MSCSSCPHPDVHPVSPTLAPLSFPSYPALAQAPTFKPASCPPTPGLGVADPDPLPVERVGYCWEPGGPGVSQAR